MSDTSIPPSEMSAADVLAILDLFEKHHIEVIVDGGWGVDALLGEQTRSHADLDVAMPHRFVPLARRLLEERGYADVQMPDTHECNFVMGDPEGHRVDFHTYTFDEAGSLVFGLPYPPDSLTGRGFITSREVRCITPAWMVSFHTGYHLDDQDYHDVSLLCRRFAIQLPKEYQRFERANHASSEAPAGSGNRD